MAKEGYKFQVSKTYSKLGMMINIRADTQKEFEDNIESAKYVLQKTGMLKKEDAPVVAQQDRDDSQDPDDFDPSFCDIHDVPMTEFSKDYPQADGSIQTSKWFSHKQGDVWCKGK